MLKPDIQEAVPIVERAMQNLLLTICVHHGRTGSDARTSIGDMLADLETLLHDDKLGEPLATCFDLAREAGTALTGIARIYNDLLLEAPNTDGAKRVRDTLLMLCFANFGRIIADMKFKSREEVEYIKERTNWGFSTIENIVADAMDAATYLSLIRLHASIMYFLIEAQRPLPRMLAFRFAAPLTTLVAAHRLYDDAGRADELREENKCVHPAFMRHEGRALSA